MKYITVNIKYFNLINFVQIKIFLKCWMLILLSFDSMLYEGSF